MENGAIELLERKNIKNNSSEATPLIFAKKDPNEPDV